MSCVANHAVAVDACRTTGTSPTADATDAARARRRRAFDTVHLLGPGAVGLEVLARLAQDRHRLVAVTDSSGTIADPAGLAPLAVAHWKRRGLPLREHPLTLRLGALDALELLDADVIIDTTSTDLERTGWTAALDAALRRGAHVVSAAKAALCEAGAEWLSAEHRHRIGCNAVLGGTGRAFLNELDELQARARAIAIVGNASTTAIIEAIERGSDLAEGIADAQRRGFLEPDPELDLRGTDAAVKLATVAGIITGRRIDPRAIPCADIRQLDPLTVHARVREGQTTRLVARWDAGLLAVRYEAVSRDSLLATPCGRVVYEYRLSGNERRLHIGTGLGAAATADAVWSDVCRVPRDTVVEHLSAGGAR